MTRTGPDRSSPPASWVVPDQTWLVRRGRLRVVPATEQHLLAADGRWPGLRGSAGGIDWKWHDQVLLHRRFVVAIEVDGEECPLGLASLGLPFESVVREGVEVAILEAIEVAPDELGGAIGAFLLSSVVKMASDRGCEIVIGALTERRAFFEKLGATAARCPIMGAEDGVDELIILWNEHLLRVWELGERVE